jgi:hypothetical protein
MISKDQLSRAFNGRLNVNPSDLETLKCASCESDKFDQVFIVKKIPSVLSPTGKQIMIPVPVFECTNCKQTCKEMYPEELEKGVLGGGL